MHVHAVQLLRAEKTASESRTQVELGQMKTKLSETKRYSEELETIVQRLAMRMLTPEQQQNSNGASVEKGGNKSTLSLMDRGDAINTVSYG